MLRRARYQFYANVTYKTCETCLAAHGVIRTDAKAFPPLDDGCASAILRIPGRQMKAFRQQSKRMRTRARGELHRRELFDQAIALLPQDHRAALSCLEQSASIDLFIPDIERLAQVHRDYLDAHPAFKDQLRAQLVKAYSDKFGWRRYERLPEIMRLQREKAGMNRINKLLE